MQVRGCFGSVFFSYDSSHGLCLQKPRKIPGVRLKVTALYISYCTRQNNNVEIDPCKIYRGG